ncbi:MAG: hypothetical protein HY394_00620 [Candidatus Diapherotrites archaeon]|nr:hypothetical protein [Candidatus Diapherotrites archaeon]
MAKKFFLAMAVLLPAMVLVSGCIGPGPTKPELCEKISSNEIKAQCYWESATIDRNPGLCQKVSDAQSRDLCYKDVATGNVHWSANGNSPAD